MLIPSKAATHGRFERVLPQGQRREITEDYSGLFYRRRADTRSDQEKQALNIAGRCTVSKVPNVTVIGVVQ